jgi:pilus assembly protein Flp/PilA
MGFQVLWDQLLAAAAYFFESEENDASEVGQGLVEYALILILVGVIVMGMLVVLGPMIGNMFSNIVSNFG